MVAVCRWPTTGREPLPGWPGAGEAIPVRQATLQRLRTLVARVLSNPSYRAAPERVRDSIQAGGGAQRAAEIIEQDLSLGA